MQKMFERMRINNIMKEDMVQTNRNIYNNKIQSIRSQRENEKKFHNECTSFINTKSEAMQKAETRRKNSYAQLMRDALKRQINEKTNKIDNDKKRKATDYLNSTGLNLPSYNYSKTTACSDCGTKYEKKYLTKVKKYL
jgi:hypothetical protein